MTNSELSPYDADLTVKKGRGNNLTVYTVLRHF